ncbi:MAG: redoxin domain-containing protein [Treponema sp.]|jgi:cytochrome c-type biogenesis protein|nr:redoxin domain-containing protein [Treponema sp.]
MNENVSVLLAFGAGVLSFLSPCVLPLVPSYLCIIGGSPATDENRPRPISRTVSFILGFSAVFIVLSVVFSAAFSIMSGVSRVVNLISGAVIIVLGINVLFDFLSFLNYEKRFHLKSKPRGIAGAFLAGGAFGAGWTPCVGPVLAGILLLAAQSGGIPRAVLYLVFYSAGLGLPFLLAALFFDTFVKVSAKLRSRLPLVRRVSGVLLIAIGVLIITGRYQMFSALAAGWQAKLPVPQAAVSDNKVPGEVIGAFQEAGIPVLAEGVSIIDFTLPLPDGTNLTLSHLKGKAVFLNFWAVWCGPCRAEMPSMEAVYQKLKDRGPEIVAVNLGDSKEKTAAFMNENRLSFPAALDERSMIGSYYSVQAVPTTYIIDRRGLIIARLVGSINWNTPKTIAALESLL